MHSVLEDSIKAVILEGLEKVVQSNTRFFIDDNLVVKVDHVRIPIGYGYRHHVGKTASEYFEMHKRSIFNPELMQEHNSLCLVVAIVIAKAYASDQSQYHYLTYKGHYDHLIEASKLMPKC